MAYARPPGNYGPPGYGAPSFAAPQTQPQYAPQPGMMGPGSFPQQHPQPGGFPPQQQPQPAGMMMPGPGGFPQPQQPKMPMPGPGAFPQQMPAMLPPGPSQPGAAGPGAFPPRGPLGGPMPGTAPAGPGPMMGGPSSFPSTGAGAAPRPPFNAAPAPAFPGAFPPAGAAGPLPGAGPRPAMPAGPGSAPGFFPPQGQPAPTATAMPGGVPGGAARPPFMSAPGPGPQPGPAPFPGPGAVGGMPQPQGAPRPGFPMQPQPQPQPSGPGPMGGMGGAPRPGFFPPSAAGPGPVGAPLQPAAPAAVANGPFGHPQQQPLQPQPQQPQGFPQQPMQPAMMGGGQPQFGAPGGVPMGAPMGAMGGGPTPSSASHSHHSHASSLSAPSFSQQPPQAPITPLAEVNEAHQCRPSYMSLSVGAIPATKQLLTRSSLPFGLSVHPLAEGEGSMGPAGIPLVNFGSAGVVRCKKCRAYINPFSRFIDGGRRWRCNLCTYCNDTPQSYFAPTDNEGVRVDLASRPELLSGSVEFLASSEYMMRPPQPPVYLFVLDCTYGAVASGVLQAAVETIRGCLDRLPGNDRTQVGFVTFDSSVHFYSLKATLSKPQQLVVADLSEQLFMPVPDDLLVNLAESRPLVDTLLASLPSMFANTRQSDSCLGAALDAAFSVMQHIGGKMVVLSTSLPSIGPGKLKQREVPKMLGSDKEHTLLAPDAGEEGAFYKNKAVDFSRQQISCDTFLFGSIGSSSGGYVDCATVGALSRYTAGQCYYYGPSYLPSVDGPRFAADLKKDLLRTTGFESVMRIRCSKGVTISNFYGNFFIRGTDLLALPNVTPATAFNVELAHEPDAAGDNSGAGQGGSGGSAGGLAPGSTISIQAALLYTATNGERRICVHTLCKPVTTVVTDLFRGVDVDALCNLYAKIALDHALRQGLHMARRYLHTSLVDLVRAYRAATSPAYGSGGVPGMGGMMGRAPGPMGMGMGGPAGGQAAAALQQAAMAGDVTAMLPENLHLLPLYILSLMKSPLYRGGDAIKSDERSSLVYRMLTMPVSFSKLFIYPRLYGLHDIDDQCGRPDPSPSFPSSLPPGVAPHPSDIELQQPPVVIPPALNLTAERLSTEGVYLLDSGADLYLWCGRSAPQQLLMALFGVPSLDGIDINNLSLQPQGNDYSQRVLAIVNTLRTYSAASVAGQQQKLRIVREGSRDINEQRFHWFLVEDKQPFPGGDKSYGEYLPIVARDSHQSAMAGVGMGGVGGVPGGGGGPGGY